MASILTKVSLASLIGGGGKWTMKFSKTTAGFDKIKLSKKNALE